MFLSHTNLTNLTKHTRYRLCVPPGRKHSAKPTSCERSNAAFCEIRAICVRQKNTMHENFAFFARFACDKNESDNLYEHQR